MNTFTIHRPTMFEHLSPVWEHFTFIVPATFMALFHVVNPIGSGILFLNLTPLADNKTRRALARQIAVNSFILMLVILLGGLYLMKLFGITIPVVQMCGGLMILTMGWRSLNRDDGANESDQKTYIKSQIQRSDYQSKVFYPYTFPFTIGPGSIAVTLTISAESITNAPGNNIIQYAAATIALFLMAIVIYVCYSSANYFMGKMPEQVRRVIMKILSFILLCIGGQIIFNGLTEFLKGLHKAGIIS
ncbi:MAG TPA: MarC family protein [Puia sp.]|nr:MarC family protein [Puia sp.]